MSSILDTRVTLLRLLGHTDFSNDLKNAFAEWLSGHPRILIEKYPEVAKLLSQKVEFQTTLAKYTSYLTIDNISRAAEDLDDSTKPIVLAEKHSAIIDRPFDIVNDYDQLLCLETLIKKVKIINRRREYVYNRRKSNKQCLIGFVCVLYRNNCFKKFNSLKPGSNKTVTLHDALLFCSERYHFGSLDSYKKNKKLCITKALEQIPGLKEFENKNKLKNSNKQRS